jgi:hypothetical protein
MDTGFDEQAGGLAPGPQSWSEVWLKALTQPSVATYEDFVNRQGVSYQRAYAWVFLASLIGSAITLVGILFLGSLRALGAGQPSEFFGDLGFTFLGFACITPLGGIIAVLGLNIVAGISNVIARALGGSGTYSQLSYAFAAYSAPLGIVTSVISMVPFVNCLSIPVAFYGMFLNILAIKSVHRFGWGKSIASSIAVIGSVLVFLGIVVIVILALLGPAIGNVFSNIIQEMGTPMP